MQAVPLLEVRDLCTWVDGSDGPVCAVGGISFSIARGETFVLLGESGSGKSMTAMSISRLLPEAARVVSGTVLLDGEDLLQLPEARMREVRGSRISMVFQEPGTSLNPVMTIGDQIAEVLRRHTALRGAAVDRRIAELLRAVGLPDPERQSRAYPFELSGGMKQRAMIAIAIACEPDLLIADEPTSALDVTIQAQVLALLRELQVRMGMAILLITHDFGVAAEMAHRVGVMQSGLLVETATKAQFFRAPAHPYSRRLFESLPGRLPRKTAASADAPQALLEVRDLKVHFPVRKGIFRRVVDRVRAVDGVSLSVPRGRTLAVVGESGSGKTTIGKAIVQLLPLAAGSVRFDGVDLAALSEAELRRRRRDFQVIFQDPYGSLNPRMRIAEIVEEGMQSLGVGGDRAARLARVDEVLAQVGLAPDMKQRYPHEFSGGQRQRIAIARAIAVAPRLIVCDEPTSALDVSVQAQILRLLQDLQQRLGLTYVFITHNMAVVEYLAHEVAVMYQGRIVEHGATADVLGNPRHPYTQTLLSAIPVADIGEGETRLQ
ncbi:MAG TPA: ABC transporter ATP-binding protein [Burkholderiales bacterium]|jgi:peptide/nickel transport system ATP-binding protein|nr:ABC transporter ATP-binding protein [Burkholderiales bacterium]